VQRHTIHDRRHRKLTDAVVNIIPRGILCGDAARAAPQGEIRAGEILRATQQPWQHRAQSIQRLLRRLTRCDIGSGGYTLCNISVDLLIKLSR